MKRSSHIAHVVKENHAFGDSDKVFETEFSIPIGSSQTFRQVARICQFRKHHWRIFAIGKKWQDYRIKTALAKQQSEAQAIGGPGWGYGAHTVPLGKAIPNRNLLSETFPGFVIIRFQHLDCNSLMLSKTSFVNYAKPAIAERFVFVAIYTARLFPAILGRTPHIHYKHPKLGEIVVGTFF
jgi:hypothetical protein